MNSRQRGGTKSACADSPFQLTQVGFVHFAAAVSTAGFLKVCGRTHQRHERAVDLAGQL